MCAKALEQACLTVVLKARIVCVTDFVTVQTVEVTVFRMAVYTSVSSLLRPTTVNHFCLGLYEQSYVVAHNKIT